MSSKQDKKMLLGNIINDISGLFSRQLKFYSWPYKRTLNHRQRQELLAVLREQHFERLSIKIKSFNKIVTDSRQQIAQLLFEECLKYNRRNQIIQLIESKLVDINVPIDNYRRTLLHRSAYLLDVELVKILIDHGVNIRAVDFLRNTALHVAIQSYRNGAVVNGDVPDVLQSLTSIIRLLLEADKRLQNEAPGGQRIVNDSNTNTCISCISMDLELNEQHGPDPSNNINNNNNNNNGLLTIGRQSFDKLVLARCGVEPIISRQSLASNSSASVAEKQHNHNESSIKSACAPNNKNREFARQTDELTENIKSLPPQEIPNNTGPLIDFKNEWGRTALHYCTTVIGEQHLAHFVKLLISYGADTDATDAQLKTSLYCLVKRPGVTAIRQKCSAITHLLNSGCDDLGLAIQPETYFSEELLKNLEKDIPKLVLEPSIVDKIDPIFTHSTFKRVPRLKHLARLRLKRLVHEKNGDKTQSRIHLPKFSPATLNLYINRKLLDQSELF